MEVKKGPILAVDPGREKCGVAIVDEGKTLLQEVVARASIMERLSSIMPASGPIVVGDRTGSKTFIQELKAAIPAAANRIVTVNEHLSSVEARSLYWQNNPPRGWRRLLPVSLQTPPVPIDDYVAVILAHRYLDGK
ncbi:MAG: pre-16S rRNA-processing nuclease YqgF [Firmicutes bacterium]|jgi:RNase H-fold protein (predicted Holliday junction resolvase)|nr:pre-16S rRNA-processing nuclease YqgF [Bacillota bacterium]